MWDSVTFKDLACVRAIGLLVIMGPQVQIMGTQSHCNLAGGTNQGNIFVALHSSPLPALSNAIMKQYCQIVSVSLKLTPLVDFSIGQLLPPLLLHLASTPSPLDCALSVLRWHQSFAGLQHHFIISDKSAVNASPLCSIAIQMTNGHAIADFQLEKLLASKCKENCLGVST